MQNVSLVQSSESLYHLDEDDPDQRLIDLSAFFLILANFLVQVSIIEVVHDDTEARG